MSLNTSIQSNFFSKIYAVSGLWPVFIVIVVYAFNIPFMFFDGFWHDDGYWFYQAIEGEVNPGSSGDASVFAPYLSYFYSYGMVHLGTNLLHFVYIGIMALISLCAYYFYHRVLQFKRFIAIPSAIIPNILPSLYIPLGFNASYAVWALLPFYLSLILLHKANNTDYPKWYISYGLAFVFYFIMLNVSAVGTFLIPCVLLFFLFLTETVKLSTNAIKSLPFLIYGLFHLYNHSQNTHKTPVLNSIDIIIDRAGQFLEMSNLFMFSSEYAIWIILVLMLVGFVGVNERKIARINVFEGQPISVHKVFVTLWLLCWLGANSVAYLVTSPTFRPHDYAYIFNFGTVLLQTTGIVFSLCVLKSFIFSDSFRYKQASVYIATVILILFVGAQRVHGYYNSPKVNLIEGASNDIRKLLSNTELPAKSQIIILGMKTPHTGVIDVNSGYVRYLTGRVDVNALIGPDRYPQNPFKQKGSWRGQMNGLKTKRPIVIFRRVTDGFERVDYLLKISKNKSSAYPRLLWRLYDVSAKKTIPEIVHEGAGVDGYTAFVSDYFAGNVPYIAFSPNTLSARVISQDEAGEIPNEGNILSHDVGYTEGVILVNMQKKLVDEKAYVQFLVRVNHMPKRRFKLGYKFNNKDIHVLGSSEFAVKGDYLLFYHPITTSSTDISDELIKFYNVGVWPYKKLIQ